MVRIPSHVGTDHHPASSRHAALHRARTERATEPSPFGYRRRRVRATERSRAALMMAVPEGCRPAVHVMEWMRAAKAHPAIDTMRSDARARMHRLIEYIAAREPHAAGACTLVILRAAAAEALDVEERTITNHFARLRDAGLLCTVAAARSAQYQPKASTAQGQNDAAIHGLTIPLTPTEDTANGGSTDPVATPADAAVDGTFSPNPLGLEEDHVRARESGFSERSRFAAADFQRQRAARAAWHTVRAQRNDPLCSRHATLSLDGGGRAQRRALRTFVSEVATRLQEDAPDARGITTAHVASLIRPFVLAGWSTADVQHALDWSPEGERHWQAATGMARIEAWMRRRLALWTRDGEPVRPFSHTQAARAAQVRAEAEADRARAAARRVEAATTIPAGPREALAKIFARNREARAAERHRRAVPVLS